MKRLLLICAATLAFSGPAFADLFYFETGSYSRESDIRWPGKLVSYDGTSKLLTFRYRKNGTPVDIQVHVTRIYSIKFDAVDSLNRDFPPTRRPLTEPLPSRLTARDQVVELSNSAFLGDDIPTEVRVNPENRNGPYLTLRGTLLGHDGQSVKLSAWNKDRAFSDFDLSALNLHHWIRGR